MKHPSSKAKKNCRSSKQDKTSVRQCKQLRSIFSTVWDFDGFPIIFVKWKKKEKSLCFVSLASRLDHGRTCPIEIFSRDI